MRTLIALAITLGVVSCDDTGNTGPDMTIPDMASDMPQLSCGQILQCALACGKDLSCAAKCSNNGSSTGTGYFRILTICIFQSCGPGDGGNHSCTQTMDTRAACLMCIASTGAAAQTAGNACHAEFVACQGH
jgi:hypothetical protein